MQSAQRSTTRSGDKKIGYVWLDGTTLIFDEYSLGVGANHNQHGLCDSRVVTAQSVQPKLDQIVSMGVATLRFERTVS